jgi:hypothetical protein
MSAKLQLNDLKHLLTEAQKDIDNVKYLHKFNKDRIDEIGCNGPQGVLLNMKEGGKSLG